MSAPLRAVRPVKSPILSDFLTANKRMPRVGDSPPPWRYRGWLLLYVVELHAVIPAVTDRWGYQTRTLAAGKLLDEPIPQIVFAAPDKQVFGLLQDWCRLIGNDLGGWTDFCSLLDWLCWGLAVSKAEPRLSKEVNEKLYRAVNLGLLLQSPWDYLGDHVSTSKARGWNPTAFFPTPHPVVALMVQMTMSTNRNDGRDPRVYSFCDPCVGSGRMLLHASNYSFRLFGQDIDPVAIKMCLINGALYAPWISFPLPDSILGISTSDDMASIKISTPADSRLLSVGDERRFLLFD